MEISQKQKEFFDNSLRWVRTNFKLLVFVFFLILLSFGFGLWFANINLLGVIKRDILTKKIFSPKKLEERLVGTATPTKNFLGGFALIKKAQEGEEVFYLPCGNYQKEECNDRYKLIRSGEWLIYGNQNLTVSWGGIHVYAYNLVTGELNEVYSEKPCPASGCKSENLETIRIFENVLAIEMRAEEENGERIYWLNLPPKGKAKILGATMNGKIYYWKNLYWVLGEEKENNKEYHTYWLLNPVNMSVKKIARTPMLFQGDPELTEKVINIDKRLRMLIAGFYPYAPQQAETYKYIFAVSMNDPNIRLDVISQQEMPGKINEIYFLEKEDQLLLINKTEGQNYIYDFALRKISKTEKLPNDSLEVAPVSGAGGPDYYKAGMTSLGVKETKLPDNFEFVFRSEQF